MKRNNAMESRRRENRPARCVPVQPMRPAPRSRASSLRARGPGKDISDVLRHSQESQEADQISQQCLRLSVSVIRGEIDQLIIQDRREPQLDLLRLAVRTVNSEAPSSRSHDSPSSLPWCISPTRQIRVLSRFDTAYTHYRRVP